MERKTRIKTDRIFVAGIEIEVQRKKIKNMHLTVRPPDGRVRITVPLHTKDEAICCFAASKSEWIRRHADRLRSCPRPPESSYVTGDSFDVWGQACPLEVQGGRCSRVELIGDTLVLTIREGSTIEQRRRLIKEWYRRQLKESLPALMEKWGPVIGVRADSAGVRDMRTRWGTCNIRDKKIWLSLRLAKMPPRCLEYVVVHELIHLKEKGHNKTFYGYLDRYYPEWKAVRQYLRNHGGEF